jgi:hypothetical protein
VVIGLHFGEVKGEYEALRLIRRFAPACIVLVVLKPMEGTGMSRVQPPSPEAALDVILEARLGMPDVPVLLGCARPMGKHQERLDRLAVSSGVNGVAFPSDGLVAYARALGLDAVFSHDCCSFIGGDQDGDAVP